ncbi:hypothetical protein Trydic_g11582 [Trypoxylus dichotomus]
MSEEVSIPDGVREFVKKLIEKYNLSSPKITYTRGSNLAEGLMSKTYGVDISDDNKSLRLFLKFPLDVTIPGAMPFDSAYSNEVHFYEVIIPKFTEFLKEKGIEGGFQNLPKCYEVTENKAIALENLKTSGYELCDKTFIGNEEHTELIFRTYAKFHAIGFAYKDQKPEEYGKLVEGIVDLLRTASKDFNAQTMLAGTAAIQNFLKKLDPEKDKFILDQSQQIFAKLADFDLQLAMGDSKNSVLIQGDCWCNNMMFKYNDDKRYPLDMVLFDWQFIRSGSPAFDISSFFYTTAPVSKKVLKRLDDFLEIYHEELSKQLKMMGSDAEILYPLSALKKEWQQYCKFGFFMAFLIIKKMLAENDQMPNFETVGMEDALKDEKLFGEVKNEAEYFNRLRNLTEHFLLNEFF